MQDVVALLPMRQPCDDDGEKRTYGSWAASADSDTPVMVREAGLPPGEEKKDALDKETIKYKLRRTRTGRGAQAVGHW